jgi:hypothetical protein
MHTLEPFYRWRPYYIASQDKYSPFYGTIYSEFEFSTTIYNYYIHPQWDDFGSETLYTKLLYVDYNKHYAIIEMIGEWNDCLHNDIMLFKQAVIDRLQENNIDQFIIIAENVLAFHASDDCYYEEWCEDIADSQGWICMIGLSDQVQQEMQDYGIDQYLLYGPHFDINWRPLKPAVLYQHINQKVAAYI